MTTPTIQEERSGFLFEVTINGTLHRLSMQGVALTHWWDIQVTSFDPPVLKTDTRHGGLCSFSYGSISFSPELFEDDWPPVRTGSIVVLYTTTTEEAAEELFSGSIHLTDIGIEEIEYELYPTEIETFLLDESYVYDEDAISVVEAATYKWTQIGATNEYYCELLAGGDPSIATPQAVIEEDEAMTEGSAVGSLAEGEWIFDDPGTGYDTVIVYITGGVDPDTKDDGYLRVGYLEEEEVLPRAFGAVVHEDPVRLMDAWDTGYYRYDMGNIQGTVANCGEEAGDVWCVYDDGVDISDNVSCVSENVFELDVAPVGNVTISGTGEDSKLVDIFDWAEDRASSSLWTSTVYTNADNAATVSYWADSQVTVLDFLSKMTSWTRHLFYFRDNICYLINMTYDNGTLTITNYDDIIDDKIEYQPPICCLVAEWTTRAGGSWADADNPGEEAGVYVYETDEVLTVDGSYTYGDEETYSEKDVFAYERSDVRTALTDMLTYLEMPDIRVKVPAVYVVLPGQKIEYTDYSFAVTSEIEMNVREIHYDVEGYELTLVGEGTIAELENKLLLLETGYYLTTESGDYLIVLEY